MRIGYLFRGYLGDIKMAPDGSEVSSPDGNATYSWSIEHEANRRRHRLIPLGENLDEPAASRLGGDLFKAFSHEKRTASYTRMLAHGWTHLSDSRLPELDVVLLEWRWPIPGRNTAEDRDKPGFQTDLDRQWQVIREYSSRRTPIVIWDLDHKFTQSDFDMLSDAGVWFQVIETAVKPRPWAKRVEPPTIIADLLQHEISAKLPAHHLGYIGSRYERDATIDKWIAPIARNGPKRVRFWGKWEPSDDVTARWPGVNFAGRIGVQGFLKAYSSVAAVPLLAKQSYYESGFITPRPWEAILFGSVPIGLNEHVGIGQYCEYVATSAEHLLELSTWMRTISRERRNVLREDAAHRLSHMDVRNFMDVIEGLVEDAVAGKDPEATAEDSGTDTDEGNDAEE